jgi:hypothetical protein
MGGLTGRKRKTNKKIRRTRQLGITRARLSGPLSLLRCELLSIDKMLKAIGPAPTDHRQ